MSLNATANTPEPALPDFKTTLGHPRPLWMLFMTEFWERFAFYGIRWALVLYIVAQFYNGSAAGEGDASRIYGAYLALVYAAAIFGGYVADRVLGYQRSILTGAIIMAAGLFMISLPQEHIFKLGLATIIVGNGLFKPNISTMVGKLYGLKDERRDSGFTIFYMGINIGAMIAPVLTEYLARKVFGTDAMPSYKVVFIASGVGMLISLVWFYIGRAGLKGIGAPPAGAEGFGRIIMVLAGAVVAIPVAYFLLATGATALAWILGAMFTALAVLLLVEGVREGKVQRDRNRLPPPSPRSRWIPAPPSHRSLIPANRWPRAIPRWRRTSPPSPGSARSSTRRATPPMTWPPPRWKPSAARSASCSRSATPPVSAAGRWTTWWKATATCVASAMPTTCG